MNNSGVILGIVLLSGALARAELVRVTPETPLSPHGYGTVDLNDDGVVDLAYSGDVYWLGATFL